MIHSMHDLFQYVRMQGDASKWHWVCPLCQAYNEEKPQYLTDSDILVCATCDRYWIPLYPEKVVEAG
jgi:hypothetical protein